VPPEIKENSSQIADDKTEEVIREEWIKPELSSISTEFTLADDALPPPS
jgi:hypothetical protein